jgi:uncharacterized protein
MILPDLNLLVYAHDADSPYHAAAVQWRNGLLAGTKPVGIAAVTGLGFIRLVTGQRSMRNLMPVKEAVRLVRSWLARPHVEWIEFLPEHLAELEAVLSAPWPCSDAMQ